MGLFSRTLASLSRNLGKTILLLVIVFILGCVISGAISVRQAIQNTDANVRATLPSVVTVDIDHAAMEEVANATGEWPELEEWVLSVDRLSEIGTLPYVESYDISVGAALFSTDIELYAPENQDSDVRMWGGGFGDYEQFQLAGLQNVEPVEIREGVIEVAQGRLFNQVELDNLTTVAIVSENFAQTNGLGVGSTMNLRSIAWDWRDVHDVDESFYTEENIYAERAYDLEIVGIFRPSAEIDIGDEWASEALTIELENRIYVPNTLAQTITVWEIEQSIEMEPDAEWHEESSVEDLIWHMNTYSLHTPDDIPAFRTAVEDMTPDFFTVLDASSHSGADATSSLDSLSGLSNIILIIAVAASVLILSLLITLFIRERRREIGIYLAIGEGRIKVAVQVMLEILVVALLAVVLSLFVGNIVAANISESMLAAELSAAQNMNGGMSWGGPLDRLGIRSEVSPEEILASYNVSLNAATILIFFAAAISTVIVSTIIPMLYILRLNPRKIMM